MASGGVKDYSTARASGAFAAREGFARGEGTARGLLGRRGERGEVAHLAPLARLGLAVEVQLDVGEGGGRAPVGLALGPEVAEEVRHRRRAQKLGRAEREVADGAQLLLELAGYARVE